MIERSKLTIASKLETAPGVVMRIWNAKMLRTLRQQLVSAGGKPVKGAFSVVLLSRRYNARSDLPRALFLELLDYGLE